MSDGHRTSIIPRPRLDDGTLATRRRSGPSFDLDDSAPGFFDDFTTPIPKDKRLVRQRRGRLVMGMFATLIALAIGAALFVLPVKSWMKQNDDIATRTSELATLDAANQQLQSEVDRLQTDAGIREAAREEIDYVDAGEQRITVLPLGPGGIALPVGWPYDIVTQILSLRRAEAQAAVSVVTPTTG